MINCKNCTKLFEGNYCSNCGQKVIDKRFTVKESLAWLFSSIFNLEKGFLYTSKELLVRPGVVVKEYIKGVTIRYAHPFRFLFVWATISTLIGVYTNAYDEIGQISSQLNTNQSPEQIEFGRRWSLIMKQYMSFIIMGMIPFYSLSSFLIYKRKGLNFAEHLIVNSYANGLSVIVGLPVVFMYLFLDKSIYGVLAGVSIFISVFVLARVYSKTFEENIIISFLKYIAVFAISILMIMVFSVIAVFIHLALIKFAGLPNIYKAAAGAAAGVQ